MAQRKVAIARVGVAGALATQATVRRILNGPAGGGLRFPGWHPVFRWRSDGGDGVGQEQPDDDDGGEQAVGDEAGALVVGHESEQPGPSSDSITPPQGKSSGVVYG